MSSLGREVVVLLHVLLPGSVADMLLTFAALSCGPASSVCRTESAMWPRH
ncbi:MAG: hypothetical protein ABI624_09800 [Casimicrobiaceae bacterium]